MNARGMRVTTYHGGNVKEELLDMCEKKLILLLLVARNEAIF